MRTPISPYQPILSVAPTDLPYQPPTLANFMSQLPQPARPAGQVVANPGALPTFWTALVIASVAASAYHGYKRNDSVGWGVVWGLLGGIAPVITPAIAVAEGFGKRAR